MIMLPLKWFLLLVVTSFTVTLCSGRPLNGGLGDATNEKTSDMKVNNRPGGDSAMSCRCKAGYHAVSGCMSHNTTHCLPCDEDTFSDSTDNNTRCRACSICKDDHFKAMTCTRTYDTKCAPCHKASIEQQKLPDYLAKCKMSSDDPMSWLSAFGFKAPKFDFKFDDDPNKQEEESFVIGGMMGDTYIGHNDHKTDATSPASTTLQPNITPAKPMPLSTVHVLTTEKMVTETSTVLISSITPTHGAKSHSTPVNSGPVEPQNAQPVLVQQSNDNAAETDPDESNQSRKTRNHVHPMSAGDKANVVRTDSYHAAGVTNGTETDPDDESVDVDDDPGHRANSTVTHVGAINKAEDDERLVSYWVVIGATLVAAVVFFLLGFLASRRASKPKEDEKVALPPDPLLLQRRSSVEFRYRRRFSLEPGTGGSLLARSDSFRGKPLMVDKSVQTSDQETAKIKKGIMFWRSSSSSSSPSPTVKDVDDIFVSPPKDKRKPVNEVESSIPLLSSQLSSNMSAPGQADDAAVQDLTSDQSGNGNRELKPNNSFRTFKAND